MTDVPELPPEPGAAYAPLSPGAELRATREAHGLTIDDAAQQLKLAPRQVQALEDDDYARLPGRTFVRGFVRNYARFLGLDPDELVARLPDANVAPALERPTLPPSGRPMGELPMQAAPRRNAARFLIPLVLLALVAAAGYYEYRREQAERVSGEASGGAPGAARGSGALPNPLSGGATSTTPGESATQAPASGAGAPGATGGVPLANPLGAASGTSSAPAGAPAGAPATGGPGAPAGAPATGGPGAPGGAAAIPAPPGASSTSPSAAPPAPGAAAAAAPAAAAEGALVLTFKGSSWAQVKDRDGKVLLSETGQAGSSRSIAGTPPFEVVIGNATAVSVTYRGQPVDIGAFSRGNVARFALK